MASNPSVESRPADTFETKNPYTAGDVVDSDLGVEGEEEVKRPWWHSVKEAGSALQIIIAAVLAIGIGMAVVSTVDEVPQAAVDILGIPGNLWLRALQCIVLPLIVVSMILAMQRLKAMSGEGTKLATWTIGYYVCTTILSIVVSVIMTALVWAPMFVTADEESLEGDSAAQEEIEETPTYTISESVVQLFYSFVPKNFVGAMADTELLSVLVASVVIGVLLNPKGSIIKAAYEIETLVTTVITFLIKCAPVGVFFLILSNLFRLDLATMGENLGYLIAGTLSSMAIHLFIVLPIIFFSFTRRNPYEYWFKMSPAWLTAWGSASSAATLPVTMKCIRRQGVPNVVAKFAAPLGCLINMDGTAIYFPICVTFLAETQGIKISAVNYIIILFLSTLASIGTTPIPSSSLVLTVMIANSINVPITGMYAVVVAIDWFLDRFRTALNVTGDCFGSYIVTKMTGLTDEKDGDAEFEEVRVERTDSRA